MKTVNLAIVGVGVIGERLIQTILKHEAIAIKAIFDVSSDRLNEIKNRYQLSPALSVAAILENPEIDAVYLAVPPKHHFELAMAIIKAKKHLLCEKPLANSTWEAKVMYEEAEKAGIIHAMNFPLFYSSAFDVVEATLRNGDLGEIKRINITGKFPDWPRKWQINNWIDTKDQGGFVREVFTHFIQLVVHFMGPIEAIDSLTIYPDDPQKSEVNVIGKGVLTGGVPVLISGMADIGHPEDLRLSFYGSEGTLELVNWRDVFVTSRHMLADKVVLSPKDASFDLMDHFYKAIIGQTVKIVDFKMGYETTKIVEDILA